MRTLADPTSERAQSLGAAGGQGLLPARAALIAWPAVMVAAVYWTVGRIGFNPTDQGFILAAAHRILLGQVPHRDFITPRPAGSPLLHTLDFLVPGPLFEASTLVAIAEVIGYSLLLGALVFGVGPLRWRPLQSAAVAAAALVNLHRFPLMAWPTSDGLLLVAAGFWLVHRGVPGRRWNLWAGFLLLGAACTVKQSFLLAPVLAMVYTAIRLRHHLTCGWWPRLAAVAAALLAIGLLAVAAVVVVFPGALQARGMGHPARAAAGFFAAGALLALLMLLRARPLFASMLVAAVAGSLLPAVYVAVIAAFGGLSELRTQLGSAAPAYGTDAFREVLTPQTRASTLAVVAVVVALAAGRQVTERWAAAQATGVTVAIRLALSGVVLYVVVFERLAIGGTWGTLTFIAVAALTVVELGWSRDWAWAWPAVAVLACAWMAMLSWGYFWPDLVAGSVALLGLATIWRGALDIPGVRRVATVLTTTAAAAALAVGAVFMDARLTQPLYLEPAASRVNVPLADVSSSFGQIRTDAVTHEYLEQIRQCVMTYPASHVAVLPDNAAVYPAMGLDDPLPIDWFYGPEYVGSEGHLLAAAQRLDRTGHYLVLFQTVYAAALVKQGELPAATPELVDRILADQPPALTQVHAALHGQAVTCGSFAGFYRP